MPRPSQSPIAISSASPTPSRPNIPLPRRRLSSRIREQGSSPDYNQRPQSSPPTRTEQTGLMPPPRPQGLAIPTASDVAGPSHRGVIDLTEDDDDEVEYTGRAFRSPPPAPAPRPTAARQGLEGRFDAPLPQYDERMLAQQWRARQAQNGGGAERMLNGLPRRLPAGYQDEVRPRDTAFEIPPHQPRRPLGNEDNEPGRAIDPRRPIGLGGAVLQRGGQRINYNQAGNIDRRRADHQQRYQQQEPFYQEDQHTRMRDMARDMARARRGEADFPEEMIHGILADIIGRRAAQDGAWEEPGFRGIAGMEGLFARLHPAGPGQGYGYGHAPGPAEDPQAIIAAVPKPEYVPPGEGFTSNFEIDDTIEIDQPKSSKKYLACTNCFAPLYLRDSQKTPDQRIWVLRCGHLMDQKCLHMISSPQVEKDRDNITRGPPPNLDVLGDEEGGRGRKGKKPKYSKSKKATKGPVEYEWHCPVKGCGEGHMSVLVDAEWKQDDLEGAFPMYV